MQKTLKIALLWLVLVLLPVPLVVILNTQLVDEPKNLIIYDCGLGAGTLFDHLCCFVLKRLAGGQVCWLVAR